MIDGWWPVAVLLPPAGHLGVLHYVGPGCHVKDKREVGSIHQISSYLRLILLAQAAHTHVYV